MTYNDLCHALCVFVYEGSLHEARIVGALKSRVGVFGFSKTPYGISQTTFYRAVSKVQQLNSSSKVGDRSKRACETLSRLVFSTCTGMTIAIGDSNGL